MYIGTDDYLDDCERNIFLDNEVRKRRHQKMLLEWLRGAFVVMALIALFVFAMVSKEADLKPSEPESRLDATYECNVTLDLQGENILA